MKLMAKKPDERYQSAAEMLRDLAKIRGALNTVPIPVTEADASTGAASSASASGRVTVSSVSTLASRGLALARSGGGWLSQLRLSGATLTILVGLGLVAGLLTGWNGRSENLLSEHAHDALTPITPSAANAPLPALWMAPHWDSIPRQSTAEAQYRYAQLRAAAADREAAWIAVPGYFPDARAWAAQAYIQLARLLLRRHDADRLRVFGAEIARWNTDQAYEHENELVTIIQAAVKALDKPAIRKGLSKS